MEVLPPVSYPSSNMNWFLEQGRTSSWSPAENKMFENTLAVHDKDMPDRCRKVAAKIPGKTVEDVILHYRDLELDVSKIEAGLILSPGYLTSLPPFTLEVSTSYMFDGFKPSYNFRIGRKRSASTRPSEHERKKDVPWTEEHKLFLMGLKKYGKGDWRNIPRNFVITKTPTQVASHAQKYFIRQLSGGKDKRRASIHDITTVNLDETRSPSPDNGQHPSPDCSSSYAMLLRQPIPALATSFLWNQPGNGGTVTIAASYSNVLLPPLPLGAGSNKIKKELHPWYDDGTFTGIHNKVFQMQSGDCYYRRGWYIVCRRHSDASSVFCFCCIT